MWNRLLIICCLALAFGCKAKKQVVSSNKAELAAEASKREKLAAIASRQIDFSTFSGRAKTQLAINDKSNDVTLNIRIKKDQKIWISVTAIAGLEVARALITPDSIKLLNRLEGTYMVKPLSFIYQYTSKQINFKTLESLLIGNCIPEQLSQQATLKNDSDKIVLTGKLQDLDYQLTLNEALKVLTNQLDNAGANQSLRVVNADFRQLENRILPYNIRISSEVQSKQISIGLQYARAEFDLNLDFPFTIPSRFSVVN